MKKIFLLGALVCAGHLYGMEPLYPQRGVLAGTWQNLPTEIESLIITAGGNNLDEAVKNIVGFSRINAKLNNMVNLNDLQGFTKIAHILADRFGTTTAGVAYQFNTPVAQAYNNLNFELLQYQFRGMGTDSNEITKFIEKGADVNFTSAGSYGYATELRWAIENLNVEGVKIFLKFGAIPTNGDWNTVLKVEKYNPGNKEIIKIKELIEEAIKKRG